MRISDWSSDVCSSDLYHRVRRRASDVAAVLAEAADRHVEHAWIRLPHRVVAEAEPRRDARAEALDEHVAVRGEPEREVAAFRAPEVEDDAPLAAVGDDGMRRLVAEAVARSEEHTSELQSLMRISYAVFCLKKKR